LENDSDPFNLQRFINAQESVYEQVRAELVAGRKRSHWMWFIFPQIRGLGSSPTAQRFAISGLEEGAAYLENSVLGRRLEECTSLVNANLDRTIGDIFGSPDDLKFHSSMTLFSKVAQAFRFHSTVYNEALAKYFHNQVDKGTIGLLDRIKFGDVH
jgi:uncharacterized protein (DUF1810 family)